MFHVYVLMSATIRHRYVWFSENLDDRFRRHNAGESKPTTRSSIDFASHGEIFKARRSNGTGAVLENGGGRDELDRLHVTVVGRQYSLSACTRLARMISIS